MTQGKAIIEARKRWGATGFAHCVQYGYRDDQCEYRVGYSKHGKVERCGVSEYGYEQAFAAADDMAGKASA